eukprot:5042954-Amphidinium_carterae.1
MPATSGHAMRLGIHNTHHESIQHQLAPCCRPGRALGYHHLKTDPPPKYRSSARQQAQKFVMTYCWNWKSQKERLEFARRGRRRRTAPAASSGTESWVSLAAVMGGASRAKASAITKRIKN